MKLILFGILIYLLYTITLKPLLSNNKLVDTNQWSDQEEEEIAEYEEVED